MRHGKNFNHLGRKRGHRKAMLRNLAVSLIEHKRISTTLAKAKALRVYVEPIITRSKENSMQSRRMAFRYLQSKHAVKELFAEVGPLVADRPGGYCRVIRTGTRLGDNAETAIIELVDFNLDYNPNEKTAKTGRTRRSRRRRSNDATDPATAPDTDQEIVSTAPEVTPTEVGVATDAAVDAASEADATSSAADAAATDQVTDTDQTKQVQGTTPEGLAGTEEGFSRSDEDKPA